MPYTYRIGFELMEDKPDVVKCEGDKWLQHFLGQPAAELFMFEDLQGRTYDYSITYNSAAWTGGRVTPLWVRIFDYVLCQRG